MPILGLSLVLAAIGAILMFTINVGVSGSNLYMIGAVLMAVGIFGSLMSALLWTSFAPFARRGAVDKVHDEHIR